MGRGCSEDVCRWKATWSRRCLSRDPFCRADARFARKTGDPAKSAYRRAGGSVKIAVHGSAFAVHGSPFGEGADTPIRPRRYAARRYADTPTPPSIRLRAQCLCGESFLLVTNPRRFSPAAKEIRFPNLLSSCNNFRPNA
jgi:hypothetical protein